MDSDLSKEWVEGEDAYKAGKKEDECPYDMREEWGKWADWVCGHGNAWDVDLSSKAIEGEQQ